MKRLMAICLAVAMLVSLCACAGPAGSAYKGTFEELDTILQSVSQIPIATMGVSMTITACAVELLDWCEATTAGGEELGINVKIFCDALEPDAQELFREQVSALLGGLSNLSRDDVRAGVLESAGFSPKRTWSEEAFALAACIDNEL